MLLGHVSPFSCMFSDSPVEVSALAQVPSCMEQP